MRRIFLIIGVLFIMLITSLTSKIAEASGRDDIAFTSIVRGSDHNLGLTKDNKLYNKKAPE